VGRTGKFTAAESYGVIPDIIAIAKGLASGLPIGAVMTTPAIGDRLAVGDLGSTFGGGPVPCAAALATLDVIERENLIANAVEVGDYIRAGALALGIPAVTGRGLLVGLRLGRPAVPVQRALFERRVLTGTASDPEVLRLMPPLSFNRREADLLLGALREVLE
jgi:acetylornithine/succinyldiaminopimelate/putrescine aminotransferase